MRVDEPTKERSEGTAALPNKDRDPTGVDVQKQYGKESRRCKEPDTSLAVNSLRRRRSELKKRKPFE